MAMPTGAQFAAADQEARWQMRVRRHEMGAKASDWRMRTELVLLGFIRGILYDPNDSGRVRFRTIIRAKSMGAA